MDLSKCDIEIVKVAENHVEKRYVLYTDKDEKVTVRTEHYGQVRIDGEIAMAETKKTALDNLVINDEKAKEDVKLAELALIQAEMDK